MCGTAPRVHAPAPNGMAMCSPRTPRRKVLESQEKFIHWFELMKAKGVEKPSLRCRNCEKQVYGAYL